MNNKGFMLAEVIIVSAIIVTVLVTMYSGLNKLYIKYDEVSRYYNIDAIYAGKTMSDYLIDNGLMDDYIIASEHYALRIYNGLIYDLGSLPEDEFIKKFIELAKKEVPDLDIDSENLSEEDYNKIKEEYQEFKSMANSINAKGYVPIMKKYNVKSMYFIGFNYWSLNRYFKEIKNTDFTGEYEYIYKYMVYVSNEIKSKYITNNTTQGISYTVGKNPVIGTHQEYHYPNDYPLGVIITVITSSDKDYYGYVVVQ